MKHRLNLGRRSRSAFTLIELLVVIVILGILMAVAVPTFLRQQAKAQDSRTQQYLTTAFKAIRSGLPDTNNQYPAVASMVSWITESEPELAAQSGSCTTGVQTAAQDAVLVDPSSTSNALTLCARSQSGNVFKLTASATGVQQLLDGTLVALTESGNEITDTTRAADVQGDGLSSDSSTGIWEATTNLIPNGGFEANTTGWTGSGGGARTNAWAKFGSYSYLIDYTPSTNDASAYSPLATCSAGQTYTASAWVNVLNNVAAGVTVLIGWYDASQSLLSYSSPGTVFTGAGVDRLMTTATAPASTAYCTIRVVMGNNVGSQRMRYYVDGVQLEQKQFATPYVETSGATATRNSARVQAPASLLNATQGWVAVRLRMATGSSASFPGNHTFFDWGNPNVSAYELRSLNGQIDFIAPAYSDPAESPTWNAGDYVTVIGYWKATTPSIGVSFNGTAFVTGGAGSYSSIPQTSFDIGGRYLQNGWADADILWFACGTGTLSNADAATISGFGNTDPKVASFPAGAQATMVWNGAGSTGSLK